MAKSKPVGVRFDLGLYFVATTDLNIKTYQQWLSYLEKQYFDSCKLKSEPIKKESPVAKIADQPINKETILISTKENPQIPVREDGEDQFDFASRKNLWKQGIK